MDQFVKMRKVNERDVIGELIDGNQEKLQYVENQINEIQKAIIEIDNDKVGFYLSIQMDFTDGSGLYSIISYKIIICKILRIYFKFIEIF